MKLGIAGESGSGRHPVNLLFRFYDPVHGRITIDGQDIREFSTSEFFPVSNGFGQPGYCSV